MGGVHEPPPTPLTIPLGSETAERGFSPLHRSRRTNMGGNSFPGHGHGRQVSVSLDETLAEVVGGI